MSTFFNELNKKLESAGYSEEQINQLSSFIKESNKIAKDSNSTNNNEAFDKILTTFAQNPKGIIDAFKQNSYQYLYDFGIALVVTIALVVLALNGILGTCETSTILGGIVGYLLGNSKK